MSTRAYVPSTLGRLRDVVASGGIGPVPVLAHAVTDALREVYADGGEEEWEYAAMVSAAQDSLALIGAGDRPRRVVIAVDAKLAVPVTGSADVSLVELQDVVPGRNIAAVHVDSADAEADVADAVEVWARSAEGDPEATRTVARCLDHELGWFAAQEIGDLLDEDARA